MRTSFIMQNPRIMDIISWQKNRTGENGLAYTLRSRFMLVFHICFYVQTLIFDSYEQGLIRDVIAARIPAQLTAAKLFR